MVNHMELTNFNNSQWQNEDSLPAAFLYINFCTKMKFPLLYMVFCTKMKFPPLYMVFGGTGAGQHYPVGYLSLLSPQARGASVMSLMFQSVRKGICDEYMTIWGLRLRSSPAIFTGQGHINKVILFQSVCNFFQKNLNFVSIFFIIFLTFQLLFILFPTFQVFNFQIRKFSKNFKI